MMKGVKRELSGGRDLAVMRIEPDADYRAAISEAIRLADSPPGTREAKRLSEAIQAVEEYEARRGWWISESAKGLHGLVHERELPAVRAMSLRDPEVRRFVGIVRQIADPRRRRQLRLFALALIDK